MSNNNFENSKNIKEKKLFNFLFDHLQSPQKNTKKHVEDEIQSFLTCYSLAQKIDDILINKHVSNISFNTRYGILQAGVLNIELPDKSKIGSIIIGDYKGMLFKDNHAVTHIDKSNH